MNSRNFSNLQEKQHFVKSIDIQLLDIPQRHWQLNINPAAVSEDDVILQSHQRAVDGNIQHIQASSIIVFDARETK